MIKVTLFSLWKEKEKQSGRRITEEEIAAEIGVSRNTVTSYMADKVKRPDKAVIEKFCRYFGVEAGPVPFIRYEPD